jgi:hypothetical protein
LLPAKITQPEASEHLLLPYRTVFNPWLSTPAGMSSVACGAISCTKRPPFYNSFSPLRAPCAVLVSTCCQGSTVLIESKRPFITFGAREWSRRCTFFRQSVLWVQGLNSIVASLLTSNCWSKESKPQRSAGTRRRKKVRDSVSWYPPAQ